MHKRGTESLKETKIRLKTAENELNKIPRYDYLVVNDKLKDAVNEIKEIIKGQLFRIQR
ncbi:MAG: hypothetical protein ABH873_02290 [Candidatus Firestonebacteria bacterium]